MTSGSTSYLHLDQVERVVGDRLVVAATAATAWPSYSAFSRAMQLQRQVAEVHRAFADERLLRRDVGEVGRGDHRLHAGQRPRLAGVDRDDPRVRVRAAHDLAPRSCPASPCRRRTSRGRSPCRRRPGGPGGCRRPSGRPCADVCSCYGLPSHFGGGVEHRADHLVIAGAAAQVAGQPVARLGLGRVRCCGRAAPWPRRSAPACRSRTAAPRARGTCAARDAARRPGDALDRRDLVPLGLGGQHQAGARPAARRR